MLHGFDSYHAPPCGRLFMLRVAATHCYKHRMQRLCVCCCCYKLALSHGSQGAVKGRDALFILMTLHRTGNLPITRLEDHEKIPRFKICKRNSLNIFI